MRKWYLGLFILCMVSLWGCSPAEEVWETVADAEALCVSVHTPTFDIRASLPQEAALVEAFSSQHTKVYAEEESGCELTTEIRQAQSLDALLLEMTGFSREHLEVIGTSAYNMPRYDLTWTCTDEEGFRTCRAAIIDDGIYYYVATSSVPLEHAEETRSLVSGFFDSLGLYNSTGV